MVFSCKAVSSGVLSGLNRSQHLALLTQELLHCLSHSALLQERGSMLALALVTLQLEKLCPDWLALAADLLRKVRVRGTCTHAPNVPPPHVGVGYLLLSC